MADYPIPRIETTSPYKAPLYAPGSREWRDAQAKAMEAAGGYGTTETWWQDPTTGEWGDYGNQGYTTGHTANNPEKPVAKSNDQVLAEERAREQAENKIKYGDLTQQGDLEALYDAEGSKFGESNAGRDLYESVGATAFQKPGQAEVTGTAVSKDLLSGALSGNTAGVQFQRDAQARGLTNDPNMIGQAWGTLSEDVDPNLDAYYDLAFQKDQRRINRAASARGRLSSTDTMRNIQESSTELSARQAKEEADYKLKRAEAMMKGAVEGTKGKADWMTSMGDLAFNAADERREYGTAASQASSLAQEAEMNRMKTGFAAALGVDAQDLAALMAKFDAASGSQSAQLERVLAEPNLQIEQAKAVAAIYNAVMGRDADAGTTGVATSHGASTSGNNDRATGDEVFKTGMETFSQLMQDFFPGGFTGGGGGTGSGTASTGSGG